MKPLKFLLIILLLNCSTVSSGEEELCPPGKTKVDLESTNAKKIAQSSKEYIRHFASADPKEIEDPGHNLFDTYIDKYGKKQIRKSAESIKLCRASLNRLEKPDDFDKVMWSLLGLDDSQSIKNIAGNKTYKITNLKKAFFSLKCEKGKSLLETLIKAPDAEKELAFLMNVLESYALPLHSPDGEDSIMDEVCNHFNDMFIGFAKSGETCRIDLKIKKSDDEPRKKGMTSEMIKNFKRLRSKLSKVDEETYFDKKLKDSYPNEDRPLTAKLSCELQNKCVCSIKDDIFICRPKK